MRRSTLIIRWTAAFGGASAWTSTRCVLARSSAADAGVIVRYIVQARTASVRAVTSADAGRSQPNHRRVRDSSGSSRNNRGNRATRAGVVSVAASIGGEAEGLEI